MPDKKAIRQLIGENVKRLRTEKKWTQKQLAEKVGVAWNTIYRIESGARGPSWELMDRLMDTLGVGVKNIFKGA